MLFIGHMTNEFCIQEQTMLSQACACATDITFMCVCMCVCVCARAQAHVCVSN